MVQLVHEVLRANRGIQMISTHTFGRPPIIAVKPGAEIDNITFLIVVIIYIMMYHVVHDPLTTTSNEETFFKKFCGIQMLQHF